MGREYVILEHGQRIGSIGREEYQYIRRLAWRHSAVEQAAFLAGMYFGIAGRVAYRTLLGLTMLPVIVVVLGAFFNPPALIELANVLKAASALELIAATQLLVMVSLALSLVSVSLVSDWSRSPYRKVLSSLLRTELGISAAEEPVLVTRRVLREVTA